VELFQSNEVPAEIDFLSIDTEGSELEIIQDFDFDKYRFNFICIEHNNSTNKAPLNKLLTSKGYLQVAKEYSQFDDYYVESNLNSKFRNLI
jgi:hypothetical protein